MHTYSFSVFYHEHVLVKEPSADIPTPWHHDQAYYPIDGEDVCSIWMPVDPVSEEATLRFVKGSHKWSKWFFPRKFKTSKNYEMTSLNENLK
jgi:ectoine hydroxylase-related dioxygenase (phytanoyl-CoA dioxygenase family)